jgi:hypothetical protein
MNFNTFQFVQIQIGSVQDKRFRTVLPHLAPQILVNVFSFLMH